MKEWYVYIILCSDDSLYTGITTDLSRRLEEHAGGAGAKFFRGRSPLRVVYSESGHDRSSATRREAQIKKLPKKAKAALASTAAGASPAPTAPLPS